MNACIIFQPKDGYAYIIEGKTSKRVLLVEDNDILVNADGEVDCPLDVVMRKNQFSFSDMNKMASKKATFVKIEGEKTVELHTIPLNVNL